VWSARGKQAAAEDEGSEAVSLYGAAWLALMAACFAAAVAATSALASLGVAINVAWVPGVLAWVWVAGVTAGWSLDAEQARAQRKKAARR
jgi:hypothetical protein